MLLLVLGLTWCTACVYGYIPRSNVCYQHTIIQSACNYGNLTVALIGTTLKPKDCNTNVNIKDLEYPPFLYINSTNATEQFTVLMVDLGPDGRAADRVLWMVTNVTINTLPNYQNIPINNILTAYQKPLMMQGAQRTLIQILIYRHQNVLRSPFNKLWVSRSTIFSNTLPNLRLCGPVAGTQYWLTQDTSLTPSAPSAPLPPQSVQPVYIPMVPVVPVAPGAPGVSMVPVGSAPGQAHVPPVGQPTVVHTQQQHAHTTFPKKSLGTVSQPMVMLFVPLVILTVMFV